MRIFLWLLFLFASAIGLALAARFNPGNVVFFYPPYRIDLSLNFFLILLGLLFILVFALLKAINVTRTMPRRVAQYRREKSERDGNAALRDSIRNLFEGRFIHSDRAAERAAQSPENAGMAALIGARAAHRMQEPEKRDAWLASLDTDADLKTARLMTEIELLIDEERPDAAMGAVNALNAGGARHVHALQLALKANQRANNWPEVLRLTRTLDKSGGLHPAVSRRLRELAYQDMLADPAQDADALRRFWQSISAPERRQPTIALHAAASFNARGMQAEAARIIEDALDAEWDARLIAAYLSCAGDVGSPTLLSQIERCETWLGQRPDDADLALTLGSLCLKQQLWGKAQRYLEQALRNAIDPAASAHVHLKLAQLHESLDSRELAASHYRQCALANAPRP